MTTDALPYNDDEIRKEQLRIGLNKLTPRQRQIVLMRYGLDGYAKYTFKELARVFYISVEHVRKICDKATRRCRNIPMNNTLPYNIIMGVDPGLDGGFARLLFDGEAWHPEALKIRTVQDGRRKVMDHAWMKNVLARQVNGRKICFVEEYVPMHVQGRTLGATSIAKAVANYVWWLAYCSAMDIAYVAVRPGTWKRAIGVKADKGTSVARCQQLFPTVNLLPTERCRKYHDGMAEALLIAEYGRRKMYALK